MYLEFAAALLVWKVFGVPTNTDSAIARVQSVNLKFGHHRVFASLQSDLAQKERHIEKCKIRSFFDSKYTQNPLLTSSSRFPFGYTCNSQTTETQEVHENCLPTKYEKPTYANQYCPLPKIYNKNKSRNCNTFSTNDFQANKRLTKITFYQSQKIPILNIVIPRNPNLPK